MSRETSARMATLADLSRIMFETRLADLRSALAACETTRARIAALDRQSAPPADPDLPLVVQARNDLLYDQWAEGRRADLNRQLARQMVAWRERRTIAAHAFGRSEALRRLDLQLKREMAQKAARLSER